MDFGEIVYLSIVNWIEIVFLNSIQRFLNPTIVNLIVFHAGVSSASIWRIWIINSWCKLREVHLAQCGSSISFAFNLCVLGNISCSHASILWGHSLPSWSIWIHTIGLCPTHAFLPTCVQAIKKDLYVLAQLGHHSDFYNSWNCWMYSYSTSHCNWCQ